jgi:hypothetical protein
VSTDHCVHDARTNPLEKPVGKVTEAVAVERVGEPARGVESTTMSGPFSEKKWTLATVPSGTFRASISTVTGEVVLIGTSGASKEPDGCAGTSTPPRVVTRMEDRVEGRKRLLGVARLKGVPLALPVNDC